LKLKATEKPSAARFDITKTLQSNARLLFHTKHNYKTAIKELM